MPPTRAIKGKALDKLAGQWHSAGRQGQTHPEDVSCELVEVLHTLRYGLVRPHWLFFLQQKEKETMAKLKTKAPG